MTSTKTVTSTKTFTAPARRRRLGRDVDAEWAQAPDSHAEEEVEIEKRTTTAEDAISTVDGGAVLVAAPAAEGTSPALQARDYGRKNGPVCAKCAVGVVPGAGSGATQYCCPIRTTSTATSFVTTTTKVTIKSTKIVSITKTATKCDMAAVFGLNGTGNGAKVLKIDTAGSGDVFFGADIKGAGGKYGTITVDGGTAKNILVVRTKVDCLGDVTWARSFGAADRWGSSGTIERKRS